MRNHFNNFSVIFCKIVGPELVHAALNQIYGIEGMEDFYSDEEVEEEFEGIKKKKKVRPHELYKNQMMELRKFGFLNET